MRQLRIGVGALVLFAAAAGWGQGEAACTPGVSSFSTPDDVAKKDSPYSATIRLTVEQTLANGTVIRGEARSKEARDSAGRTMRQRVFLCQPGKDGQVHPQWMVNVVDPESKAHMSWIVGGPPPYSATLTHASTFAEPMSAEDMAARRAWVKEHAMTARHDVVKTEQLGMREFSGVTAVGRRTTTTIPIGAEGNDRPIEVVDETWKSAELGIVVMKIMDDPRGAKTTFELEEVSRAEPEAAVFAPPAGYKVREMKTEVKEQ